MNQTIDDREKFENRINRFETFGRDKIVRLKPYEKIHGNVRDARRMITPDTWITTDIHITPDKERNQQIIDNINNLVGDSGTLLILGDIGNKKLATYDIIASEIAKIRTPNKMLILGNHDMYKISDYAAMGFKFVSDEITCTWGNQRVKFTHTPYPVNPNMINVHGHLHGTSVYGISEYKFANTRNFYDAYIYWNDTYVRNKLVVKPTPQGYPPVQQLRDLYKHLK